MSMYPFTLPSVTAPPTLPTLTLPGGRGTPHMWDVYRVVGYTGDYHLVTGPDSDGAPHEGDWEWVAQVPVLLPPIFIGETMDIRAQIAESVVSHARAHGIAEDPA